MVNFGQRGLVVFSKLLSVRDKATVEFDGPVFAKRAQRNSRIVLNDERAVIKQEIADAGKTFVVHEIRRGFDQTHARPM